MRISLRQTSAPCRQSTALSTCFLTLTSLASLSGAITITPAPSANLDLSQLGRIGVAGDFSGLSLFEYEGMNEKLVTTNGTESLMTRLPNGLFLNLAQADGSIRAMCKFQNSVVLGGNFTSLDGQQSQAVASFDQSTAKVNSLAPGLSGQVNALLCDEAAGLVYVGGNFRVAEQPTNAIIWLANNSWSTLPFAGFNGPVTSISKAPTGHIVFGGSFTGLGNVSLPSQPDGQIINLSTARITTALTTTSAGFSEPRNIICKTSGVDGPGNTWLLQDNVPGWWDASFDFGFQPTKLRLWNTHQDGRGTRTWRFTARPINGIMNFTYVDPATGQNASCTSECPLSNDPNVKFQDFHFVNLVGMNAFRIDVSAFYGSGGGLNGIELFGEDISAYAVNDFNEPECAGLQTPSKATATGPWTTSDAFQSSSKYLRADLSAPIQSSAASVVFFPDIRESGSYSVNLYTPGCTQDSTCSSRGQVTVSGTMRANSGSTSFSSTLYQTNNFDKYDQIYFGQVDASTTGFRPSVTLTPLPGQTLPNNTMTMVAQRVGFTLINTTASGLNGLFEYDPSNPAINTSDITTSAFTKLGTSFATGAAVHALALAGEATYIGGNFNSSNVRNIAAINRDNTVTNIDGGLNGEVESMYVNGNSLVVAGSFSGTVNGNTQGLNNVAIYDIAGKTWSALGAGVNGVVSKVVPLDLNVTGSSAETVIALTGDFTQLLAFGTNQSIPASGFGIWVPSQRNWLQNLNVPVPAISGLLTTALLSAPGNVSLFAGSLSASTLRASGAATLGNQLGNFPIRLQPAASSATGLSKRAPILNSTVNGIVTGAFYGNGGRNITILAGHFATNATNGSAITNLALINGADSNTVTGLGTAVSENSTFVSLGIQGDNLFAGGFVTGRVNGAQINGLISYNLASNTFNPPPPALVGPNVSVTAVQPRPNSGDVFVGGNFDSAGSLPCPAVCTFSTSLGQWNRPGLNLDGSVNCMMWASDSKLIAGGSLVVNSTSVPLATFDTSRSTWESFPKASSLPGPVEVLTPANSDGSQVWVAGTASDGGSVYLSKYDGSDWKSAGENLGKNTVLHSLQVFSLTSSHDSTPLVDSNQVLMLTGSIDIPGFGTASAAIFNGTAFAPYALTSNTGTSAGTISRIFTQNQNFFTSSGGGMPLVFIVLIALAVSLGLMLLIVLAGLALDRYRKKRDGYIPAPTSMYDRGSGIQRIPPHELLDSLSKGRPGAPHV